MTSLDELRNTTHDEKSVSSPDLGKMLAGLLRDIIPNYIAESQLSLAAGAGFCELAFAEVLNVSQVTLVDIEFPNNNVGATGSGVSVCAIELVNSTIDEYLATCLTTRKTYDVITLFGGEFVLNSQQHFDSFLANIHKVLNIEGLIVISNTTFEYNENQSFKTIVKNGPILILRKVEN